MYERHFGFTENPFRLTPDPQYLYLSDSHKEALASLMWGVQARTGFVAVLGEAGTGKTTLLRHFLGRLDQTVKTVCILNTNVPFEEMLGFVLRDLGINTAETSKTEALEAFNRFLHAEYDAGRNVVILVDEAQNLSPTMLEELRLLSNFETTKVKLLQIILAGQPRLRDMLANSDLQQVRQRISLLCALDPLGPKDTSAYIAYRLRVAGYRGKCGRRRVETFPWHPAAHQRDLRQCAHRSIWRRAHAHRRASRASGRHGSRARPQGRSALVCVLQVVVANSSGVELSAVGPGGRTPLLAVLHPGLAHPSTVGARDQFPRTPSSPATGRHEH
jgi:type II secretory pathway predicted ATPase ExeA